MKMKKTDIGVVAFMYAVCAFFYAYSGKLTAEKSAAPAEKAPRSDIPAEGGDRRRRSGRRGGNGGANAAGSTGAPAPKAVKPAGDGQGTVSGEKKRSRHRPRRRSGGSKPNGGTEA